MSGVVPAIPRLKFTNATGVPVVSGSVAVYLAGTSTLANTYQDKALTILNNNPVPLDGNGEALFWLDPSLTYKFLLKDANNATVTGWPVDNILGGGNSPTLQQSYVDTFSGDGSQTVFTLSAAPGNIKDTNVYVGGVYQKKSAYNLAGSTLTFVSAPTSGTNNIEVTYYVLLDFTGLAATIAGYSAAAAASASDAQTSALAASTSETNAAGSVTAINNRIYPGTYTVAPTTRPDGSARQAGDEYFDATANKRYTYNGTTWVASDINTANLAASSGSSLVGFIQAGTGAVARTAQSKAREIVSVLDFGAVGDGVTNDRTAVVNAIAALSAGGELWFPPGKTYLIGTSIAVTTDGIRLRGAGYASAIKAGGSGDAPIYLQGSNQEVTGLRFIGDQSGGAASRQSLVYIGGSGKTPSKIKVKYCYFENSSSSCVTFGTDLATCADIEIAFNTMINFWECGVDAVGPASNVRIHHNTIRSNTVHPNGAVSRPIGIGYECQVSGAVIDGWDVTDNEIDFSAISTPDRNTTHGVSFGKASTPPASLVLKRALISRNRINGVGMGLRIPDTRWGTNSYGVNLEVCDNILTACRDHGMYLRGGEDASFYDVLVVTGNTIKGASEFSTNARDGMNIDQNWTKPLIDDNWINSRNGETGATGMRYGINIAAATVLDAKIGDNTISGANSGRINDASAVATFIRVGKALNAFVSTNATLAGDLTFTADTGSVIFRSPSGADRNITPSTAANETFQNGHMVTVGNTSTGAFNLIFDPSGINSRVGPQSAGFFIYDKPAGAWRQVRLGLGRIRETAANIALATATVNTADKYAGKQVWDTTNHRTMVADGPNATDLWYVCDGSASVTPV